MIGVTPSNTVVDWKFPSELYGAAKALSVGFIVKPVGEPDAGNPHVRFDERGGKRDDVRVATAPNPDSTEKRVGFVQAGTKRECCVRPNGADRQWVEVPPR